MDVHCSDHGAALLLEIPGRSGRATGPVVVRLAVHVVEKIWSMDHTLHVWNKAIHGKADARNEFK